MSIKKIKIIAITSEEGSAKEYLDINALFETGLELLHIRKPAYTRFTLEKLIDSVAPEHHSRIVLHSHYELLDEYNLKGIHLPEQVRKQANLKDLKKVVSTSFHNLDNITTEKYPFEYAFYSPVFESISKQGYKPATDLNTIRKFFAVQNNTLPFPLVGLGGVTDKNIAMVRDLGFSGAACIGYLWESDNPAKQLQNLMQALGD